MSEPTLVRRALDELLRRFPTDDLVSIDWQLPVELHAESTPQRRWTADMQGPWVLTTLGQPDEPGEVKHFAIWKHTGDLYEVGDDGAVPDDPIWSP